MNEEICINEGGYIYEQYKKMYVIDHVVVWSQYNAANLCECRGS